MPRAPHHDDDRPIVWAYVDEPTLLLLARLASHRRTSLPDIAGQLIAQALRAQPTRSASPVKAGG